jgi:predicted dehydrogenase
MTRSIDRRSFLKTSAASVAAFAAPAVNVLGAAEAVNVGCIGTGGRCRFLMKALAGIKNARMTAVCDIYGKHMDEARAIAGDKAASFKDFRKLLDDKAIDAVLIGSPDHWHVPMTIEAMAAGKDVYIEKPLTHSLEEGKTILEAAKKHDRIVQVGTQQRSMPQFQKGYELIRSGKLGKIHKVHLTWNRNTDRVKRFNIDIKPDEVDWKAFLGNAPDQKFDPYRFRNWRWFWDFGGGIFTDLMVHFIDVAHWYLGLDHPEQAVSIGSQIAAKDVWETPDSVQTLLTYPDGLQAHFEGNFSNAREAACIWFMGTEASLYLDRGRLEVHPEPKRDKNLYEELILGDGPRGADFYKTPDGEALHLTNWLECIKSRKQPVCPIAAGVSAASAAHLANMALRKNQVAKWSSS